MGPVLSLDNARVDAARAPLVHMHPMHVHPVHPRATALLTNSPFVIRSGNSNTDSRHPGEPNSASPPQSVLAASHATH